MPLSTTRSSGTLIVLLATIAWGTSGIFITWIIDWTDITPLSLAFWRDLVTLSFLFVFLILFNRNLLKARRGDIVWFIAMGVISVAGLHVIWNMNVLWNGVALATVTQATAPIFVTVIAWLVWREPLTHRKFWAIGLAVLGIFFVTRVDKLNFAHLTFIGLLIGLSSALSYSLYSIFGKRLSADYNPWTIMFYTFGIASLSLLPFQSSTSIPGIITLRIVLVFLALVFIPTIIGYVLYTIGLGRIPASIAAVIATAEVPIAAIYAFFALGERLDVGQIFGAILIICSVVMISLPSRRSVNLRIY